MGPSLRLASVAALIWTAVTFSGCTSVDSSRDPSFRLSSYRTYAWLGPSYPAPSGETAAEDVEEQFQAAIDRELAGLGLRRVSLDEAELEIELEVDVEVLARRRDPFYSGYVAERYEDGVVTLTFIERQRNRRVWTATARRELRTLERVVGVNPSTQAIESSDERQWPIESLVRSLIDEL